ncbi:hypothetical protein SAMN05443662_1055 [Sulfurivirga caldicuralii]|uniref:Uncharacterized protein n=1 Tax=Sulfurivirga caldicuralii TaxID=364032 RepID=A0A1N6FFC0_9GAMM|nr:hypothetical protein [Sulfurivirga caldicuralii]SIN93904.1 hypothetical protein SAMN05443662_1055 [Sulfurivirga caldicuralii]
MNRLISLLLLLILAAPTAAAVKPSEVTFMGLELAKTDLNQIRKHLWRNGGFMQAPTTVRQINVDIFYPWSRMRDSYLLEFHYDPNGKFQWLKRVYRFSPHKQVLTHNSMDPITTKEVALTLEEQLGPPNRTIYRQWGGMPGYYAYEWKDDIMTIRVDRVDGDPTQPVFVLYRLNQFNYQYAEKGQQP